MSCGQPKPESECICECHKCVKCNCNCSFKFNPVADEWIVDLTDKCINLSIRIEKLEELLQLKIESLRKRIDDILKITVDDYMKLEKDIINLQFRIDNIESSLKKKLDTDYYLKSHVVASHWQPLPSPPLIDDDPHRKLVIDENNKVTGIK